MNRSPGTVAVGPFGVVTVTFTVPAPGGETAVTDVLEFTVKLLAAVPPKSTALACPSCTPVIVTVVPPVVGPDVGLMRVTEGTTYVKWSIATGAEVPGVAVTWMSTTPFA